MIIESLSRQQLRRRAVGWSIAALVSAGVGAGGIYGWTHEGESDPIKQDCAILIDKVYSLETNLFKDGTLGSDGGLIVRYLEIRNPDDSRLRTWGQLKNEKDKVCAQAQKHHIGSLDMFVRMAAMGGPIFSLFSIQNFLYFGRLFRNKQ